VIFCDWAFIAHTMHFISFLSIVFIHDSACFKSEIFETVGTQTSTGEEIKTRNQQRKANQQSSE